MSNVDIRIFQIKWLLWSQAKFVVLSVQFVSNVLSSSPQFCSSWQSARTVVTSALSLLAFGSSIAISTTKLSSILQPLAGWEVTASSQQLLWGSF
ncbi:hypothetical protein [Parahaliea mediterranea]|uniref:hypothetical protein n=1 Tax=Parahaliea mediterranea TaxID=651086 RepID=UPI0013005E49|nr:hypothetical protein [Parahaliea mediterranea]